MIHLHYDGIQGFRSRFDDLRFVHEFLEELPSRLGLQAAMPPFLLPYYNGVEPEDCGISSFLFLVGGHLTLHTFSLREALFLDLVSVDGFETAKAVRAISEAFPCRRLGHGVVRRSGAAPEKPEIHVDEDFGPHLFLDVTDYTGPDSLDDLFQLFDRLPSLVGMTPIMRPYVIANTLEGGEPCSSAMTMIAESHVSVHVFPERQCAYFDLFSCRFFDVDRVLPTLRRVFPGRIAAETMAARGERYRRYRTDYTEDAARSRAWLAATPPQSFSSAAKAAPEWFCRNAEDR